VEYFIYASSQKADEKGFRTILFSCISWGRVKKIEKHNLLLNKISKIID